MNDLAYGIGDLGRRTFRQQRRAHRLDALAVVHDEPEFAAAARAPDDLAALLLQQLDQLREGLNALPSKDRMVLALYYYENLTLREIGEVLHVTESRVSQLHTKAILRLRGHLAGGLAPSPRD
mgnify:CR=1 FL=1